MSERWNGCGLGNLTASRPRLGAGVCGAHLFGWREVVGMTCNRCEGAVSVWRMFGGCEPSPGTTDWCGDARP